MTTPEPNKESGERLVRLAVELDEQLKSNQRSDESPPAMRLPKEKVDGLSEEELNELSEASEVLAFLGQVRSDIIRLETDSQLLAGQESGESNQQSDCDSTLGESLGRFQIKNALGQGGFARVFRAFDPLLDRDVALKIPRPEVLSSQEACSRFIREGKAAAMLSHSAIVAVFEAGTFGPIHYIASALCSGETLAGWQSNQPAPVLIDDAAAIVARLAEAIHHAHQRGIIHRDLKPSNIMMDLEDSNSSGNSLASRVRITDFGLAKQFKSDKSITLTIDGSVVGTPAYMSPEQVRCDPQVGPGTDVYSLGVILHELLTGVTPHQKTSITATIRAVEADPVPPLLKIRSETPDSLDAICRKCLEKGPNDRYASAFALSEDLNRFLNGLPVFAKPVSPMKRLVKWAKRNPIIATSIAITFTSLIAGVATSWSMYMGAVKATEEKSDALDLAQTRMLEMNEQMDLLVGIFDKIDGDGDDDGSFSKELLVENLRENLVDASEQIFSSSANPSLRSKLASRLGHGLAKLGFEIESEKITSRAFALGQENGLPEHELLDLELHVAFSHPHEFKRIIDTVAPKLEQIMVSEHIDELKKMAALNMLVYAYNNLPNPGKALTTQERLVTFRESLRQKLKTGVEANDTSRLAAVREYFQSPAADRDEARSRFYIAENKYKLNRSEDNLKELLKTREWIESTLGPNDWITIGTSYIVAGLLGERGQTEQAIEIGESAYRNSVESLGKGNYQTITAAHTLMIICCTHPNDDICKQRLPEFTKECEEGCRLFLQSENANSQGINILGNVAIAYGMLGRFDKAIEVQRSVLKTAESLLGEDSQVAKQQKAALRSLAAQQRQQGFTSFLKGLTKPDNKSQ